MDNDEQGLPCKNKIPFKTKEEAIGAVTLAKHRYGSDKHKVYKCKHCESWHIARA
jgi:hypothetical protein